MLTTANTFRPIDTDYSGWEEDLFNRVAQYAEQSPYNRSNTFYFSNSSGSDANDGLHPTTAKQTLTECQSLIDNEDATDDIRFSFQRGDMWDVTAGLDCDRNNTTFAAHGSGDRPFFNFFAEKYTTGWALVGVGPNCYRIAETTSIAWLRMQHDRMGTITGQPLSRQDTPANCETVDYSWHYDGSAWLYVNLGGTDPDTVPLEGVATNQDSGIEIGDVDGCRVQSIRVDGAGMSTVVDDPQTQAFTDQCTGDKSNLYVDLQGNFSGSHVLAHYATAGTGGRSCWVSCEANYPKWHTAGETMFNTFSTNGEHETLFINCFGNHGTLPSTDWAFATEFGRGTLIYGHTGTATDQELVITYKTKIYNSINPILGVGGFNDLTAYTKGDPSTAMCFIVKTDQPYTAAREAGGSPFRDGHVLYGCRMRQAIGSGDLSVASAVGNFMMINCDWEVDTADRGDSTFGFFASSGSGDDNFELISNRIHIKNANATTANKYGFHYLNRTNPIAPGAGQFPDVFVFNNILTTDSVDADAYYVGIRNEAAGLKNNAYYGFIQDAGQERGWDGDLGAVVPSSLPLPGLVHADLLEAGGTDRQLSHDMDGRRRLVASPDIGPVDYSSRTVPEEQKGLDVLASIMHPEGEETFNWPTSLNDLTVSVAALPADMNAQCLDVINVDPYSEPVAGPPPESASLATKINYLYKNWRNKKEQTATGWTLYNTDDSTPGQTAVVGDDDTTASKAKIL